MAFIAPLADPTVTLPAEVCSSESISDMLATSDLQLTQNKYKRRSWRRGRQ